MAFINLEAIQFQGITPVAQDLIDLFGAVIDTRDSTSSDRFQRINAVYGERKMLTIELRKIFNKHFNIKVNKVYLEYLYGYAIDPHIIFETYNKKGKKVKKDIFELVYMNSVGQYVINYDKKVPIEKLSDMDKLYDRNSGKINYETLKSAGLSLEADLFFDIQSGFLSKEIINNMADRLNEKELAAIELHELGHLITMVEMLANLYCKTAFKTEMIKTYVKYASNKEKIDFLKKSYEEKVKKDKQRNELQEKMIDTLEKVEMEMTVPDVLLGILIDLIVLIVFAPFLIINEFFMIVFTVMTGIIEIITRCMQPNYKIKEGDLMYTRQNRFLAEYWSDDFALRNGLGAEVITGLQKIIDMMSISQITMQIPYSSYLTFLFSKLAIWTFSPFMYLIGIKLDVHEPEPDRFFRLMRSAIGAFKNANLDDKLVKYYIGQYEAMEKAMKLTYNDLPVYTTKYVLEFADRILDYLQSPLSHNITNDITALKEMHDALINNRLYYSSAKLEQLLKK